MHIDLKIIQTLFDQERTLLREFSSTKCLTGFFPLRDAVVPYSLHMLYVCSSYEEIKNIETIAGMNILCIINSPDSNNYIETHPQHINLLTVISPIESPIYQKLQYFFNEKCGIGLYGDSLMDILINGGGIQEMVDYSFRIFDNPILVFNSVYNIIAANWDELKKTPQGEDLAENKGFSEKEFQMANSRNHIHDRVLSSKYPIRAFNEYIGHEQLLSAISTKKNVGHIVMTAANREFSDEDIHFFHLLRNFINEQLKKDDFIRNSSGFNYEYFLKDLLDEKIATDSHYLDRMNYVNNEFLGNIYCLVIEVARSSIILNTYRIRKLFEKHFPKCKSILYHGEIIIILTLQGNRELTRQQLELMASLCKEHDLFAGLSNPFDNIIHLFEYYKQALRAIELGICVENEPSLFPYQHYYLRHMLNMFVQKESSETFCHPKMKILLEYDQTHKSKLAYTLYMYLIHERNIASASDAMSMHRTSLVYRFKKIHELIGDDFDNYQDRLYLILSYEIENNASPHGI